MKIVSVLALATLALTSVDRAAAVATCTTDQVSQSLHIMMELADDANCAATPNDQCSNAKCLESMKAMAIKFPDCTTEGKNMKDEFAKTLTKCESSSASASTSMTAASVALASTAVAAAMVCMSTCNAHCAEPN